MKISIVSNTKELKGTDLNLSEIPTGTVFTICVGGFKDKILLKTYDRVINLKDPSQTWKVYSDETQYTTNVTPTIWHDITGYKVYKDIELIIRDDV